MMRVTVPFSAVRSGDVVRFEDQNVTVDRTETGQDVEGSATTFYRVHLREDVKTRRWDDTLSGFVPAVTRSFDVAWEGADIVLVAGSGAEVGARVADALDKFDTQVRAHVARTFCRTCGERECVRHAPTDFAWLIECAAIGNLPTLYWDGIAPNSYTSDPNRAVRFARKEDGQRVLDHFPEAMRHGCEVREHGWS